ncbi:hypothetical protein J2X72_002626 [Phyllobacterium sp. 1468]|uniref:hypothetical protein n=1 Tax=Phyllobacterium sp. 1468 TaxID=2817759 RepID=UPI0028639B8C|nr:hypothetical protein [Phyllobacterium sp. 1468]MDR6633826.1 hypothetical protein [Phyllobacterium sp. 1468]
MNSLRCSDGGTDAIFSFGYCAGGCDLAGMHDDGRQRQQEWRHPDAKNLVIVSYQCQDALGREPHYSAIESSETILQGLGKSADEADSTVRGWLRAVIASPKQPADYDAKTCKDRLLTLAEKVRAGYESLRKHR